MKHRISQMRRRRNNSVEMLILKKISFGNFLWFLQLMLATLILLILVVYSLRPRFLSKITFFSFFFCVTLAKSPAAAISQSLRKRKKINRSAAISIFGNRRKLQSSEGTKKVSVLSKRRRFNKKHLCVSDLSENRSASRGSLRNYHN